jgi:molybdenum cofactor cytidylyltransferase
MKFGPVSLDQAEGTILGHHIAGPDGRRAFRKGKPLTAEDVHRLRLLGFETVYVAELEPGDIEEDRAAALVAGCVIGGGMSPSRAQAGRVNLQSDWFGLLRVDAGRLAQVNECEGLTVATLLSSSVVGEGDTVATVKVIPFALPEATVRRAEALGREGGPLIEVQPLLPRRVSLILSGSPYASSRVVETFEAPLRTRIERLGSSIKTVEFVALEDERGEEDLARTLRKEVADGTDLILLAGETAIMDRHDIAPRAVERAGGEVSCFGAPVDPGNLLMLAYLAGVPVLGAPGCARSLKINIVDWVLPMLLAGNRLSRVDILAMGHGGLLEDTPHRPMPRSSLT